MNTLFKFVRVLQVKEIHGMIERTCVLYEHPLQIRQGFTSEGNSRNDRTHVRFSIGWIVRDSKEGVRGTKV